MPGRWFSREVACSLFVGEIRIKTGRDFPGSRLLVYTPEGITEIAGTLLSIQRSQGGTCVCVLEGIARVGVDEDDMQVIRPGSRKVMYSDGTQEIISIEPTHRDGVLDFDKRVGERIDRER
jgi:ferric-dicitrate binding protein FerR (iron transport regulator)